MGKAARQHERLSSEKAAVFLEWLCAAWLSDGGNKEPSVLLQKAKVRALRKNYGRSKKYISHILPKNPHNFGTA